MNRRVRVVNWKGKDVRPELRDLPAGHYVVEAVEDEASALTLKEEAGIEAALESYRRGRVIDSKCAREIIDETLSVEDRVHRRSGRDRQTSTAGSKSTEGAAHLTPVRDPMCSPRT